MLSLDEFHAVNPPDTRQTTSFLHHILNIAAATEASLNDAAERLERLSGPYVVAFAQLPFTVDAGDICYPVRGWREGVVVDLRFRRVTGAFKHNGTFRQLEPSEHLVSQPEGLRPVSFTQVTGVVRLWNKRASLHKSYLSCLTPNGLRNEVIGRVEGWIDAPEAKMSLPARRYAPLTAQAFQAEVANRVRTELLRATQSFIRAYSVATLEDLPSADLLYSYFIMIAPGRVACASPPIPIGAGLCDRPSERASSQPSEARLRSLLDMSLPFENRFLRQLMAMHRLLKHGEAELALIGCVTAIEWFLNETFAEVVRRTRSGASLSASVSACLRAGVLDFLPQAQREGLRTLSLTRNAIVHGPPPHRAGSTSILRISEVATPEYTLSSLFLALDLYQQVNVQVASCQRGQASIFPS